jgi:hypothetical protein
MHDTCPSIADLTASDQPSRSLRVHVAECVSCRALARLAAANGDPLAARTAACDAHEVLVAVIAGGGRLDAAESADFDRHAGSCDRCAASSLALLLDAGGIARLADDAAPAESGAAHGDWRPAVDPEVGRMLRRRRRTALAAGALLVAAVAAATVLALHPDRESPSTAAVPASPPPVVVPPPAHLVEQDDVPAAPAAPPVEEDDEAPRHSVTSPAQAVVEEARKAAFDGDYREALRLCKRALVIDPDDQEALKTCAVAACKACTRRSCRRRTAAEVTGYLGRLTSETRQEMIRQMCLMNKIVVDPPPDQE